MFQGPPREKRWQSWLFVASWSAFIWRLAPLTRPLIGALGEYRDLLVPATIAVTAAAALAGVRYVVRNPRMTAWPRAAGLLLVAATYAWICLHELQSPQEALHFLEFGFLGLLVFRALSHDLRDAAIYPAAALVGGLVGNVDEFLQWLTPGRLWDLRDWGWDLAAAALAQVAIAGGMRPPFIAWRTSPRSWQWVVRLMAMQVAALAFCLSVTPGRCVEVGRRFPPLRFLAWHENVMTEYGHLHHEPGIGSFYSRFTRDELKHLDDTRYDDVADLIRYYRKGPGYGVFLREVNAGVDPFAHEAYVHIFRRNHYLLSSYKHRFSNPKLYAHHCRVAFRENQILEKFFPRTTGFAGESISAGEYDRLRRDMDGKRPYTSPVSEHLITSVSERQVWGASALALLSLWLLDRRLSRHAPRNT